MKKLLKGFTLVEILIVIVIIGILIGALVPRMSAAQGRARDVARKNDLNQLQASIVVSYQDKGRYPCSKTGCTGGKEDATNGVKSSVGVNVSDFKELLEAAGMNNVPTDPMASNKFKGIGDLESKEGEYMYMTIKSHGIEDGSFVLMAKSEVEGSSNWVVCEDAEKQGYIKSGTDVKDFKACSEITRSTATCSNPIIKNGVYQTDNTSTSCTYKDESELRYVLVY